MAKKLLLYLEEKATCDVTQFTLPVPNVNATALHIRKKISTWMCVMLYH